MLTEAELIEVLGQARPDWRDLFNDPWEAADELGLSLDDEDADYGELRFDD